MLSNKKSLIAVFALALTLTNCGKNKSSDSSASEDVSASGAAAEAVGGAMSSSLSNGTLARFDLPQSTLQKIRSEISPMPQAFAQLLCPTFHSTDSKCSTSGGSMWLTYSSCSFLGRATWNGVQALSMSAGTATCGSFPNPGANQTLYRQFVASSGSTSASSLTLTSSGYTGTIDDSSSNLGNFDNQSIATINPNGGYGIAVAFNSSGARSSITIGHRTTVNGIFDHSVSGSLSISETAGASSRTFNGSIKVYHNLLKVVGTSTFNNVGHYDVCCVPTSGSITTVFSAGSNVSPTAIGSLLVGKSETLTFTGCGTASLTSADGSVKNVTLNRCF